MIRAGQCRQFIDQAYAAEFDGRGADGYVSLVAELKELSPRELEDLAQVATCLSDAADEAYQTVRDRP